MKVWFFSEKWKSSRGWKNAYYAVLAQGCRMTDGRNLAEAIYMAYDLIACLKDMRDMEGIKPDKIYDEPFDELNDGIFETDSRNFYIGSLEMDSDLVLNPYTWRRKGDKPPAKKQFMRFRMLGRAFQMSYKNFKLNE